MPESSRLEEYLVRTTPQAAEAAQAAMDFILSLDPKITWKLNKATVDFRAERQFCSLWPVKSHVTFWITNDCSDHLVAVSQPTNVRLL